MNKVYNISISAHITELISLKKSLGYKYSEEERLLRSLERFLTNDGVRHPNKLSSDLCYKWANKNKDAKAITVYRNISMYNELVRFLNSQGLRCELYPLPKYPESNYIPYVFTHNEIAKIFRTADKTQTRAFNAKSPVMAMPALIRFAYGTAARLGEIVGADEQDIDLDNMTFTVRSENSKNGKARIIPFDISLKNVIDQYLNHKHEVCGLEAHALCVPLFTNYCGERLEPNLVYRHFINILRACEIKSQGIRKGPHFHCIRHTAACHSFVMLSKKGIDMYAAWPYLSAYLGHQSLEATEGYIRLTSELYPEIINGGLISKTNDEKGD